MDGSYRCVGGRARVTEDAWDRRVCEVKRPRHQYGRGPSARFERWKTEDEYSGVIHTLEYGVDKEILHRRQSRVSSNVQSVRASVIVTSEQTTLPDERYTTAARQKTMVTWVLLVLGCVSMRDLLVVTRGTFSRNRCGIKPACRYLPRCVFELNPWNPTIRCTWITYDIAHSEEGAR